jgi:hypothetical protein
MRANEFLYKRVVVESNDGLVEDEAELRGDGNLVSAIELLQHKSKNTHDVPMVRVDSLINMIRQMPGTEMFTAENLQDAFKSNDSVKSVIDDIKDNSDGVKYVYIKSLNDVDDAETNLDNSKIGAERTVDSMAKRAMSQRT